MRRRRFIKGSAAALAVAGAAGTGMTTAPGAAKREHANRGRIYKAVKGPRDATPEKMKELADLGFDGVEPQAPGIKDLQAYREIVEAAGLKVHGVVDGTHWKQRLSDPDPAIREIGVRDLEHAIRDSKALGGSSVLLVPGRVSGDDETHDHVWERSIAGIREVLPIASELGIHVLIETVWNGFCETPELLRDYLDEIDSPWVGAYFDIGNMVKFAPPEQWIRTLGSRIVKLDVKDWGVETKFCKLGEGDTDWAEVRKALAEIRFTGWATREGSDGGIEETARLMDELLDL